MKPCSIALLLALAGCADETLQFPDPPHAQGTVYEDLPAPEGFVYVQNYGNRNPSGDFRVWTQWLRGKDRRVEPTVKFYKEIFPKHGWTLEKEEGAYPKPVNLSFVKKAERCRITVDEESTSVLRVDVKVNRKD